MPGLLDFVVAALFSAVWPLYTFLVEWPRHLERVRRGDPAARIDIYRWTIVQQWVLVTGVAVLWMARARPLDGLGLYPPSGWRLALGLALPAAYIALMIVQVPAFARNAGARARLRARIAPLTALVPHTAAEWRWFMPLSVTAGICEEILFRGYLVWVLAPSFGTWGAAGLSMLVFGLAHGYQGNSFGLRAFGGGIFMGLLALVTGSILPGMVLHVLVDLGSGYVSHLALRGPETGATPTVAQEA